MYKLRRKTACFSKSLGCYESVFKTLAHFSAFSRCAQSKLSSWRLQLLHMKQAGRKNEHEDHSFFHSGHKSFSDSVYYNIFISADEHKKDHTHPLPNMYKQTLSFKSKQTFRDFLKTIQLRTHDWIALFNVFLKYLDALLNNFCFHLRLIKEKFSFLEEDSGELLQIIFYCCL